MTYAKDYAEAYAYDAQGNMLTVKENGTPAYSYRYGLAGSILVANDHKLGRTDVYFQCVDGYSSIVVTYDNDGDVYTVSNADGTIRLPDGSLYVSMPDGYAYGENGTDELMRSLGMALTYLAPDAADETPATTIFSVTYTYANTKTEYVTTETFSRGSVYSYTYDKLGNLTEIKENGILKVTYTYDELCQLVREDNAYENKSFTWTYDAGGNILSKKEYAYTTGTLGAVTDTVTYTYGDGDWKDLLTNYNGIAINYDLSGNPLNWRNASTMTWDGRRLSSMTLTDGTVMSFAYNADGLRTRKTVGTETVEYVWVNGELISEIRDNYTLHFYYENGEVIGFNYKTNATSSNYYYGKDTLGVIRYLYDANGTVVTTYTYDAWGRSVGCIGTLAGTIGAVNPIRYKSYYLDAETGFYYLQSRYYDPVVGRFINADVTTFIDYCYSFCACNLFVYCVNNPVLLSDATGYFGTPIQWLLATIFGYLGWHFGDYLSYKLIGKKNWKYWLLRSAIAVGGVVVGWFAGAKIISCVKAYLTAHPAKLSKVPKIIAWILGLNNLTQSVNFRNAEKLSQHFIKHSHEWGNKIKNIPDYLKAANDLLRRKGEKIYEFFSREGYYFKYDANKNEFIILDPNGFISTFFRPIEKILYWYEQVRKYGS